MAQKKPAAVRAVEEDEVDLGGEAPPPKKKGRGKLVVIVVVVLLLAGVGGYVWHARRAAQAAAQADGQDTAQEPAKPDLYLPLEPPFVVNFKDGDSLRYLQVGVTLMSHDQKAIDTAKAADPVIRNALVSLLSNQDFNVISSAAGREKLQAQALVAVRKIVQQRMGQPGIDALYFTSYVMQ